MLSFYYIVHMSPRSVIGTLKVLQYCISLALILRERASSLTCTCKSMFSNEQKNHYNNLSIVTLLIFLYSSIDELEMSYLCLHTCVTKMTLAHTVHMLNDALFCQLNKNVFITVLQKNLCLHITTWA